MFSVICFFFSVLLFVPLPFDFNLILFLLLCLPVSLSDHCCSDDLYEFRTCDSVFEPLSINYKFYSTKMKTLSVV